ncbi:hypothetical protein KMS_R18180 [Pseudomonas sp. LRP2-20]|uniref:hypothetical protein n=1 Tax=Pseudomonas sp. LRP2-20 TaxID=2944234 RepID=UPI002184D2D1|nr:hypothetical protein [Pseudomonas sp. LRP2-20]BDM22060.1 hypothetical protein KMS_R18180 [Pseudomonas sp. LRP2-20]
MSEKVFIELCAEGLALPEEIDDYIDAWHESDFPGEIYTYLGMSQKEYRLWTREPDLLYFIITARIQGRSLEMMLEDMHDLPLAARADSPKKAKALMEWLKQKGI